MSELIHSDDFVIATQKPPGVQVSLINPKKDSLIAALYLTYANGKVTVNLICKEGAQTIRQSPQWNLIQHVRQTIDNTFISKNIHPQHVGAFERCLKSFYITIIDEFNVQTPEQFNIMVNNLFEAGHFSEEFAEAVKQASILITKENDGLHQAKQHYADIANIIRQSVRVPS